MPDVPDGPGKCEVHLPEVPDGPGELTDKSEDGNARHKGER